MSLDHEREEDLALYWAAAEEGKDPTVAIKRATLQHKLLTAEGLDNLPPPEWLVDDVLVRNTLAILYGRPGVGKSLAALDWTLCASTGCWWFARAVKQTKTLFIAAEGVSGLGKRKRAWQEDRGVIKVGDAWFLPEPVNLLDRGASAAAAELVGHLDVGLVVVDTLSRCMSGGDENAPKDMTIAIDALEGMRHASDATVLAVHHTPKNAATPRGHSALEGAAETCVEVEGEGQVLVLKCTKQKDAAPFEPIRLAIRPVAESAVLVSHGLMGQADDLVRSETTVLAALRDNFGTTGASNTDLREVAGVARSSYYRAVNSLVAKGAVRNEGTDKRPHWKLTEEAGE